MFSYSIAFLISAIIAAILGFGGLGGGSVEIAKHLFFAILLLFVISLFFGRQVPPVE